MFKLSEKHEVDRRILKCDYIRYSPSELSTTDHANSQMWINIPRQGTVIFLLISYLDLLHSANPNKRYVDGDDTQIVNLGPIAFFSNYKLTTGWEKHLEDISQARIVSLISKLLTSSKDSDVLSIGFHRDWNRRQRELTNDKIIKG